MSIHRVTTYNKGYKSKVANRCLVVDTQYKTQQKGRPKKMVSFCLDDQTSHYHIPKKWKRTHLYAFAATNSGV